MSLNAWNPVCMYTLLVAMSGKLKVYIKFEYITEAVYCLGK